jgi:hypothetical protein
VAVKRILCICHTTILMGEFLNTKYKKDLKNILLCIASFHIKVCGDG